MTYVRSLVLNFLVVFFVNRAIPGIEVGTFENVANVGADLLFSIILAFLNASVFPALVIFDLKPTLLKMVIVCFVITFVSFGIIGIAHWGVRVMTFGGYLFGSIIVWLVAIFSNYLEFKHSYKPPKS